MCEFIQRYRYSFYNSFEWSYGYGPSFEVHNLSFEVLYVLNVNYVSKFMLRITDQ